MMTSARIQGCSLHRRPLCGLTRAILALALRARSAHFCSCKNVTGHVRVPDPAGAGVHFCSCKNVWMGLLRRGEAMPRPQLFVEAPSDPG